MTDRAHTIQAMVASVAGSDPAATALRAPGRRSLSYAAMAAQFDNAGEVLTGWGLRPGDRVVGQVPDGPEAAITCLMVTNVCTYAPLAPGLTATEVAAALDVLDPAAVLVAEDLDTPLRRLAAERDVTLLELRTPADAPAGTVALARARTGDATPRPAMTALDTALLLMTSGTTSRPKLVPLSHRNLAFSAHSVARTWGLTESDCCLNVMPLFHIHGLVAGVMASLTVGASVSCAAPFDSQAMLSWLEDGEPTWYTAVPTMHHAVVSCAEGTSLRPGRLRLVRSASAPLPATLAASLEATLGVPVLEAYGMTEAAHEIASNRPPPTLRKYGTVGVPTGCEVAILDEAGQRCGVGEPGEVVIRGPGVMAGYVANPQANAAAFVDGWLRTGDQGVFDGDGFLTLTGRLKELINREGEKVAPQEVEKALLAHPQIRQLRCSPFPIPRLAKKSRHQSSATLRRVWTSRPSAPLQRRTPLTARVSEIIITWMRKHSASDAQSSGGCAIGAGVLSVVRGRAPALARPLGISRQLIVVCVPKTTRRVVFGTQTTINPTISAPWWPGTTDVPCSIRGRAPG